MFSVSPSLCHRPEYLRGRSRERTLRHVRRTRRCEYTTMRCGTRRCKTTTVLLSRNATIRQCAINSNAKAPQVRQSDANTRQKSVPKIRRTRFPNAPYERHAGLQSVQLRLDDHLPGGWGWEQHDPPSPAPAPARAHARAHTRTSSTTSPSPALGAGTTPAATNWGSMRVKTSSSHAYSAGSAERGPRLCTGPSITARVPPSVIRNRLGAHWYLRANASAHARDAPTKTQTQQHQYAL